MVDVGAEVSELTAVDRHQNVVVRLLQVEVVLLVVLPARLVIGPLGGVGSPALIFGIVLLGLWAISVVTPNLGVERACVPVRVALAVLACSVLISYAVMHLHPMAGDESRSADRYLLLVASFAGIALTCAEGLRDRVDVFRVLRVAVGSVGFMAFVAILQFRPGIDLTIYFAKIPLLSASGDLSEVQARGGFARPSGTAIHPIEFGVVVAAALGPAIVIALYDVGRAVERRWAPLVLCAIGVPVAVSRSALLVMVVVLLMFFTGAPRQLWIRGLVVCAGFAVAVFLMIPGMIGTLKGLVFAGESDSSISTRTDDYGAVASYLKRSPWVGRGPGTFLPRYRILDNQYLLTMIETGLLGVVALLLVFVTIGALGRGARRRFQADGDRLLGQMLAAAGVGSGVAAVTYDGLSYPTFTGMIAFWLGLAGVWWSLSKEAVAAEATVHSEHTGLADPPGPTGGGDVRSGPGSEHARWPPSMRWVPSDP